MPALPSFLIEPLWAQVEALLPTRPDRHPLGWHRPRIPDRVVCERLVQGLVVGAASWRVADATGSATTLRRRRDDWIAAGVMPELEARARAAYDRMIGLALDDVAVDGGIAKAPGGGDLAGPSPVDRAKQGRQRSNLVDAAGIPLGVVPAAANTHDSPLLAPTLDTLGELAGPPGTMTVHLERGYDSDTTRAELDRRGLLGGMARRGRPAPVPATPRWVVERTHAWQNAFQKLVWCTERRASVLRCSLAFATAIIIIRRLIREGWKRYRGASRPTRCP